MHFKVPCNKAINIALFVLLFLSFNNKLLAQNQNQFPIPSGNSNQLFYLQRTKNINTIVYELNIENGKLNPEKPIYAYWIMYTENQKRQDLSAMEKDFVYGIKINSTQKEGYQFTLAAYPKINLQLIKDSNQKYFVSVTPSKHQIRLTKVYIKEKDSNFKLEPTVEYIEFSGIDVLSGKEITERITP